MTLLYEYAKSNKEDRAYFEFLYFDKMDLRRHLSEIEIVMIEAALEKTDGMVSQASDALKLRRTTLIEKMKKYGISNKT